MSRRPYQDYVALNMKVPRGQEGFWSVIRELDGNGPWTIADVDARCNVSKDTVRDYVKRLERGGFAREDGVVSAYRGGLTKLYRLTRHQVDTPRLQRDGTELPETINSLLWRTMKMVKLFSAAELAQAAATEARPVRVSTATAYLKHLHAAGIVQTVRPRQGSRAAHYRLARNLGAKAPMILAAKAVYDPNEDKVVGVADALEVRL